MGASEVPADVPTPPVLPPARGRRRAERPARRWLLPTLIGLLALTLVTVGGVVATRVAPDWLSADPADHPSGAVSPTPAEAWQLSAPTEPSPVAAVLGAGPALDPAKVARALSGRLSDPDAGPGLLVTVAAMGETDPVFTQGSGLAVPASTTKLLTTLAALAVLGPDRTFRTTVVQAAPHRVVLVGGGDPLLASRPDPTSYPVRADVVDLARATATALRAAGTRRVRIGYDDTLFSGPKVNPRWPGSYIPDEVVAPISALWVDEGYEPQGSGRVADPPAVAARAFATALAAQGITVLGVPMPGVADDTMPELAGVDSAPLSDIVEHVLDVSDNEAAEVLAHHVGLATSGEGSFTAGAEGVLATLTQLGVPTAGARLFDGSGLSRDNRLAPATLIGVLQVAGSADHPDLRSVLTGLPVAGFSGSLAYRFSDESPRSRGRVRAKTGTLRGVSALAGIATDLDGTLIVFALMADEVAENKTLAAQDVLDGLAAALGTCRCAA